MLKQGFLVSCQYPIFCGGEEPMFWLEMFFKCKKPENKRGDCSPVSSWVCLKSFTSFSIYLVSAPAVSMLGYFITSTLKRGKKGKTLKCCMFPIGTLPRGCDIRCECLVTCVCFFASLWFPWCQQKSCLFLVEEALLLKGMMCFDSLKMKTFSGAWNWDLSPSGPVFSACSRVGSRVKELQKGWGVAFCVCAGSLACMHL